MRRTPFLLLVPVLALAGTAPAQPLVTDRPDFTESALAVPAGRAQLEAGATYADGDGAAGAWELGEALLRWGVRPGWEIRLQAPSWVSGPGEEGLGDAAAGFKVELPPVASSGMALLAMTSLPVATGDAGAESWVPEAILAADWTLPEPWTLGANAGLAVPEVAGERRVTGSLSAALGRGLTERLSGFVEAFGFFDEEDAGPAFADGGLTLLLHDDFQLDVRAGAELFQAEGEWFVGAGFARRW